MDYKNSKPKYSKPTAGCGIAKVGKSTWSIDVEYGVKNKRGEWDTESETFSFKNSQTGELEEVKNGKSYFISIKPDNKGGGEILQLRPAKGIFDVKFVGFSRDHDDEDVIMILESDGDYGKFWQIVANLEVVSGDFAGVLFPVYLPLANEDKKTGDPQFKFYWEDGIFNVLVGKKSGEKVKMFRDLVYCSGLSDYQFKIENDEELEVEDVLMLVEKAAKKLKKVFAAVVDKGYPKTVTDKESGDEEVEDEPVTKKVTKKVEDEEEDEPVKKVKKTVKADEEEVEDEKPVKKSRPKFDEDED